MSAHDTLRHQLDASLAAESAEVLAAYMRKLRQRAAPNNKISTYLSSDLQITIWGDGSCVMHIGGKRCGTYGSSPTAAIEAAEHYLADDDVALINATLGLDARGHIIADAAE